jgi:hypothetical protein
VPVDHIYTLESEAFIYLATIAIFESLVLLAGFSSAIISCGMLQFRAHKPLQGPYHHKP